MVLSKPMWLYKNPARLRNKRKGVAGSHVISGLQVQLAVVGVVAVAVVAVYFGVAGVIVFRANRLVGDHFLLVLAIISFTFRFITKLAT